MKKEKVDNDSDNRPPIFPSPPRNPHPDIADKGDRKQMRHLMPGKKRRKRNTGQKKEIQRDLFEWGKRQ
jgi:hypothetical protein